MAEIREPARRPLPAGILERIAEAIRSVRYGSVQVVIHDATVVQIETHEKIRVNTQADPASGGQNNAYPTGHQTTGAEGEEREGRWTGRSCG